jgi:anti-sigma B factor antagonist
MSAAPVAGPSPGSAAQVTRTVVGRRAVLSGVGEIDLDSAPLVADAVDAAVGAGALELWVELLSTEFMDSAGVHLLMETQTRLESLTRRLAVICPRGPARRVLDLTGMAERLPLYDDRAAAHRAT